MHGPPPAIFFALAALHFGWGVYAGLAGNDLAVGGWMASAVSLLILGALTASGRREGAERAAPPRSAPVLFGEDLDD